jgi:hypothetical protein
MNQIHKKIKSNILFFMAAYFFSTIFIKTNPEHQFRFNPHLIINGYGCLNLIPESPCYHVHLSAYPLTSRSLLKNSSKLDLGWKKNNRGFWNRIKAQGCKERGREVK